MHFWCLVELEEGTFYVDPSLAAEEGGTDWFLLGSRELDARNYYIPDDGEYPFVDLPRELLPPS